MVQWLRLCPSNAGMQGVQVRSGWGTKIPHAVHWGFTFRKVKANRSSLVAPLLKKKKKKIHRLALASFVMPKSDIY